MLIEELARTTELRGPRAGDDPVPDWEGELESVRLALDDEQKRFADELLRHEATVYELLSRKARATEGIQYHR